jgi:hypothetical protein
MSPKLFLTFALASFAKSESYHDNLHRMYREGRVSASGLCPVIVAEFDLITPKEDTMEEKFDKSELVLDAERFQVGVSVEAMGLKRQLREVADKMLRRSDIPNTPECRTWLESVGGLNKLNQELTGLSMAKDDWFKRTVKDLHEQGVDVSRMGDYDPDLIPVVESATQYSDRAVSVHRLMANRRAYGERDFEEGDTVPSWAATQFDKELQIVPYWWRNAAIGRFTTSRKPKNGLKQVESVSGKYGRGMFTMLDIRMSTLVGDPMEGETWSGLGDRFFAHISRWGYFQMIDKQPVKKLIDAFYNDPHSLTWKKDVTDRWVAGYKLSTGQWLYLRTSKAFSNRIDWEASDKQQYPKNRWAKGQRSVFCKRQADGTVMVYCEHMQENLGDSWHYNSQTDTWDREERNYVMVALEKKQSMTMQEYMELCGRLKKAGYQKVCVRKGTMKPEAQG